MASLYESNDFILGIDVGTTGTKAILFSRNGQILANAYEGYPLITPAPGIAEQSAEALWRAVVNTVRACVSPGYAPYVKSLSLSTQGGTLIAVDEDFRPLSNAIVWSDLRCEAERRDAMKEYGEAEIFRRSGWTLKSGRPMLQLRHMRSSQPALFEKAAYFLTVPDFISARLTGRPVVDYSNAGINQLFSPDAQAYDPVLLSIAGVSPDRLAALSPSCAPIGTLTREAASLLGLGEDVCVCAGAHDQYAVALGAGICEPGDAVIGTGTAWVVTALNDTPDFACGYPQSISAANGAYGTMLSISTGGVCLDWLRRNILGSAGAPLSYEDINALAGEADAPGAGGLMFYPYFSGAGLPVQNTSCRGAFIGLELMHTRAHMTRAVMEGVACQIAWAVNSLERVHPVRRLILAGGATKSPVWTQMIAEITGRPLLVSRLTDLACAGAAMMAGVGAGIFKSTEEAVSRMAPAYDKATPDPERASAYRRVYEKYVNGALALGAFHESL